MNKLLNDKLSNDKLSNDKLSNEVSNDKLSNEVSNDKLSNEVSNDKLYFEEWYKKNNCLDKARLFGLCMKQTPSSPNSPLENKCKNLFDEWYKCILFDPNFKQHVKI